MDVGGIRRWPSALSAALKGLATLRNPLAGIGAQRSSGARTHEDQPRGTHRPDQAEVGSSHSLLDRLLADASAAVRTLNIHAVLERVLRLARTTPAGR